MEKRRGSLSETWTAEYLSWSLGSKRESIKLLLFAAWRSRSRVAINGDLSGFRRWLHTVPPTVGVRADRRRCPEDAIFCRHAASTWDENGMLSRPRGSRYTSRVPAWIHSYTVPLLIPNRWATWRTVMAPGPG